MMAKNIRQYLNNPYLWGTFTLLAISLLVVGWVRSYPVASSPVEISILSAVSPWFWIGLCAGFLGLAGLVLTSRSKLVHWMSSCVFVLLLTMPQFLYLSWGSDAGILAGLVDYAQTLGKLGSHRATAIPFYFQWPLSIFFHQFLKDALHVDVYTAIKVGFLVVSISVGGTLFALWSDSMSQGPRASMAAFWGVVVYFAGFYWFLNWQAVPYTFFLALFMPTLALLDKRTPQHRLLLLLLFGVGIEAHALFGVWAILIALVLGIGMPVVARIRQGLSLPAFQSSWLSRMVKSALRVLPAVDSNERKSPTVSLALLMIVIQVSVIIYKDTRFFDYIVLNLKGYYQAMLAIGSTGGSLAFQTRLALRAMSLDLAGTILKVLGFLDMGIVIIAFLVATVDVLVNRKLRIREMAHFGAGVIYFVIGTWFAAIGERSFQLIAMLPAFLVVDSIAGRTRVAKVVLIASFAGLLLFPAAIVRTYQMSPNYVKPDDVFFKQVVAEMQPDSLTDYTVLSEHVRPLSNQQNTNLITTRLIQYGYVTTCKGPVLVVDTAQFREDLGQIAGYSNGTLEHILSTAPLFYDSQHIALRFVKDCNALELVSHGQSVAKRAR